jgi:hypothetical protein
MVPTRIIEAIVSKFVGDTSAKLISRATDRKTKFARMLLEYHRLLEEYQRLVDEFLQLLLNDHDLISTGRLRSDAAKRIDHIADRLGEVLSKMFNIFQHDWSRSIGRDSGTSEDAAHRTRLLTIYSPEFAHLVEMTHGMDASVSSAAASLSRDWVDWIEQKVYIFDPTLTDIPPNIYIDELSKMDGYRRPRAHRRVLDIRSQEDLHFLLGTLRDVVARIDTCKEQLGAFIRTNFTIADLL